MGMISPHTVIAAALVALMCSCAQKVARPPTDRYELHVTDDVAARRFDIFLESTDSRPVCISAENWPNSSGHLTVEKDDTYLQLGPRHLSANSALSSAYCPDGCGEHRIEPNGSMRGFISYEVFGDAGSISREPQRRLVLPVTPYYCR